MPDATSLSPSETETELAFAVPADRAEAIAAQLERAGASTETIESRYVDTRDRCLAVAGLSLRLRRVGVRWEQTLKAAPGGRISRVEHTVPRDGVRPGDEPVVEPWRHDDSEAGPALRRALGDAEAPLLWSHSSVIERQSVVVEADGAAIEVAFDRGEITAVGRALSVCELELELKQGDPARLLALARETVAAHPVWLRSESKSARGDRLRHGDDVVGTRAVKSKPARLECSMDPHRRLQAMVAAALHAMLANAGALADGDRSDAVVHQLRVSIRRFRSIARELAWMSPAFDRRWESPLVDVFRALGAVRDRDAVAATLATRLAAAGSPAPIVGSPQAAAADPTEWVRAAPFQTALLALLTFTLPGPEPADPVDGTVADKRVAKRLKRLHAELSTAAEAFESLDEPARHRVRKRLKRLRYLAESIGSLHDKDRVRRFLARLAPAQDALGEHVDLVVGFEMAERAVAGGDGASWFNVGWLRAALPDSVKRCTKALRSASRARPFWAD